MTLSTLTVKALKELAKSECIKGYSSLSKEQLVATLTEYYKEVALNEQRLAYESTDIRAIEPTVLTTQEEIDEAIANAPKVTINGYDVTDAIKANLQPTNATIKMFDVERYAKFVPNKNYIGNAKTTNQMNLVKSLENNFKVTIATEGLDFYGMSVKLRKVYNAILAGQVQYRSQAEIEARVKAYVPVENNNATKPQLEMITKLEKELGITVTTVISSKLVANQVIKSLLEQKRNLVSSEVAVTSISSIEEKLASPTFRTKFSSILKSMFNK